ncbi:MAG: hypothetical protein EBS06_02815 [Proteobacteria bacterium]|nr:hypothetical protein [Pseudomonadota bacterium]
MKHFDPLAIQHNIEEKRLILGKKIEQFLLKKLALIGDFFGNLFVAKNLALYGSIAIILLSIFVRSTRDIGQDSGLYLEAAWKLIAGGKYYRDFFENNLPFSYYLAAIPIVLAKFLSISPIILAEVFSNLLGIFTIYFSAKILARSDISKDKPVFNLIILSFAAGFFLRFFTLQFNDFNTKSTYFLTLLFPYLSYQFLRESELEKSDKFLIGLFAGLFFCLKPHYGILAIAFEVKKIREKKSLKSILALRNYITFFVVFFYAIFLFLRFPDYIKAIPAFISLYFDPKYFALVFPIKEDIYPLLLLISLCFFLRQKFDFLRQFFFASLVYCGILILELTGVYDQRSILYSLSLPLISLLILAFLRDQKINWRRDFITLLLILLIPQFDQSFFVTTAFNICSFWWIIVLVLSPKWQKILPQKKPEEFGFLRYIFLPNNLPSWLGFIVLTVITIQLSANRFINNLAWSLSAVIFILLINFYDNLHRKFVSKEKFSLLSASVIFVVLSYLVSLQLGSIFNIHEYKSPNPVNDKIMQVAQKNLSAEENFLLVSGRTLASYPVRNYLEKINPLPAAQLQNLYFKIDDRKQMDQTQSYLFERLKEQIQDKKNKLIFIEPIGFPPSDRCRIMFLEYYLRDAEFRKIFLENYVFLDRVIAVKKAEKKVKFFSDKQIKSLSINDEDTVIRDIEAYVRK